MTKYPVEQPSDAIMQIAYAVPDIQAAISWWVRELSVGPWFVVDRIGRGGTYRGQPNRAEFTVAMAYSDKMMYELVQVLDDEPSVYKEARERNGYGFHHFGKLQRDAKQLASAYEAKGQAVAFHSPTPGGGQVFFIDGGENATGFIELIEDVESTRKLFESVWRASLSWNGDRPIRKFSELFE